MKNWKRCLIVPAVWLALTAAMWFAPKQEMSISERRKLQQMPALTAQTILDGRFMTQFETYSQDQFPLRDSFRRLKAGVSYGVVRRLDNNGIYLAQGSAGKLEYPLNEASVRKAVEKFQHIYDRYLKDSSGKIVFSVVPDKSFYLAAANGYPSMDYEAMFSAFREIPWADYVDLTPALSADSYYRTDTHWRQECLQDAAALLAQSLDVDIRAEYTPVKLERPFYGVYDGQAALPMKPDELWVLESDSLYACTTYNIENRKTAQVYDMDKIPLNQQVMMQLYPEIYACIGCNACTKSCTQELNVMQYIAYAQRGDFAACAEESFDCVMCGVCSARCPAGISHPQVAMLARRINGKYLMPRSQHLEDRVGEIADGTFRELMESLMGKPLEELQELYNHRDIEK